MNAARPARRRWSLQTRLIIAVVSLVSLILIGVGLATGTILGQIMRDNLDAQIQSSASRIRGNPSSSAEEVLSIGRQEPGTLLVIRTFRGMSGAYVAGDDSVVALPEDDVETIVLQLDREGPATIDVPALGEYRIYLQSDPSGAFALLGLPTSEVAKTTTQILTAVALVTAGGLLVLAAVIAVIIGRALRPLRSVADTAARVAALPLSEGEVTISERVPDADTDSHTEIGRVGLALNTLLDHVDTSLAARQRNEERMRAFVADASHELRTPLASIRGYSELSLRAIRQSTPEAVAETTEQSLERIQAQSLRMTTLVEDLLLLARLDEGKELVYGAVDVTRLAIESVADAQAAGPDHQWRVEAGEEPVVVAGDTARLYQVAANLLANARVHTPAGTRVTATVALEDGDAVLRVHDDGPGIDPAIVDALFERFARADVSRARQTGGTGLGLSIAQAIVSAHHGTITARSAPGSTTFEVRLPARPSAPE